VLRWSRLHRARRESTGNAPLLATIITQSDDDLWRKPTTMFRRVSVMLILIFYF
jgi:hypothetical protein